VRFFRFSFSSVFSIIDFIRFCNQDNAMSDLNARLLAQRIDTVLDILVAGDYHSAIHNLEILKAELQALAATSRKQTRPT
jgi:alpha-D-ribose 1-methylphosphonate 5-triphosphate diphosphatase PhnM